MPAAGSGRPTLARGCWPPTTRSEAAALAARLDELNTERREIEARVRDEALAQAEARGLDGPLVWAAGEGWHPGVVGIVAARLKEATNRPAVVIGFEGGIGKGSARSVTGVDLGAAIQRLAAEGLLLQGRRAQDGGRPDREQGQIEPAMARLGELLARQGAGAGGPGRPAARRPADARRRHRWRWWNRSRRPAPSAPPPPPRALPLPTSAVTARRIGESHLKLILRRRRWRRRSTPSPSAPSTARSGPALERPATAVPPGRAAGNEPLERPHQVQLRLEDAARA